MEESYPLLNAKEQKINDDKGRMKVWLWLTIPIILLLIVAAGSGLFISGLYRDSPFFAAQARGQDLISSG